MEDKPQNIKINLDQKKEELLNLINSLDENKKNELFDAVENAFNCQIIAKSFHDKRVNNESLVRHPLYVRFFYKVLGI